MPVYVDDMYKYAMGRFRGMKMSHLVADSREELLAMCDKIGVQRKWIQTPGSPQEHFDIAESKRELAIKAGAIPVAMKTISFMCVRRRVEGVLGPPEDAERWRLDYWAKMHGKKQEYDL